MAIVRCNAVRPGVGGSTNYFKIRPQKNEILEILQKLEKFEMNSMDVAKTVKDKYLRQFPEVMKSLQLIIEFSDCIIQGRDLLDYDIVIDEDQQRIERMARDQAQKSQGLPNQGRLDGVQVSPAKVAHKEDGIIKENQHDKRQMSGERAACMKSYIKSNAANFYVLRNTSNTLAMIK